MIYVFCAFYGECSELIKHYNLKKRQADKYYRFDVFENEEMPVKIIITGTGSVMAAAAVSGAASFFGIKATDAVINIGTCAGSCETGKVFICNKITEQTTKRTFYPDMILRSALPESQIVTVPVPVQELLCESAIDEGKHMDVLYDMEAAAVYQAANLYVGPHRMGFLKVVSDNGDVEKLTPEFIKKIMSETASSVISYVDMFIADRGRTDNEQAGQAGSDIIDISRLCRDLHCSKVMENQVRQLIKYLSLEGTDYISCINRLYEEGRLPAHDKKNGKVCLDEIKRELL